MPVDPLSLSLALVFTAGCIGIHAWRHRPGDVTLLLMLGLIGMVNLLGIAVLARAGAAMDPHRAAAIVGVHVRYD